MINGCKLDQMRGTYRGICVIYDISLCKCYWLCCISDNSEYHNKVSKQNKTSPSNIP